MAFTPFACVASLGSKQADGALLVPARGADVVGGRGLHGRVAGQPLHGRQRDAVGHQASGERVPERVRVEVKSPQPLHALQN